MSSVCRICLVGNTTLHSVLNNILLSFYENMTNTKFHSEDARPRALCCYCYQKLLKCHTFSKMALRSEKILCDLYDNGLEVTHEYIAAVNSKMEQHLSVATMQHISIGHLYAGSQVKEEPLPHSDITDEVITEPDNLVEDCTRSQLKFEDYSFQENDEEEVLTIPAEQTKPDDSKMRFICSICNKIFDKKSKLISHLNNAHSLPTVQQYSSTGTTSMNEDQILHNVKKQFACNVCDKKYMHKNELTCHIRTHTGEKPFGCNTCYKQFNRKRTLLLHLRTHSANKLFACNVCDKKFNRRQYLVVHLRTHLAEKPFACKLCDKQFRQKQYFAQHIKIHMKEKPLATHNMLNSHPQLTVKHTGTTSTNEDQILHNNKKRIKKQFTCHECDKKYDHKSAIIRHIRAHTGEKPFACNTCDKQFSLKSTLVSHKRTHSGEKPFACNTCDKQFSQKSTLVLHKRTHSGEKPFACNVCGKQFIQKQKLIFHLRTHLAEKPFACKRCDKQFYQKRCFLRHMITHSGAKTFACDLCDKQFYFKQYLVQHIKIHRSEKALACLPYIDTTEEVTTEPDNLVEDCTKRQLTLEDNNSIQENDEEELLLTIRAESTKPDDSKMTFSCSMCNTKFDKKSELILHKINAHSLPTVKQYLSTGTSSMKEDQILHNVKKQFACNVCDKKYNHNNVLVAHMRTHTGERPFACEVCHKEFYRKYHLVRHLKIHMREKPLATHILNRYPQLTVKHTRTTSMNEDQILHNGKKQFACHACDKKYDHKSAIIRHIRAHTGEKPFACNTCDKQFSRKSTLVSHMSTHSGDKPFACNVCGKQFNQKAHLVAHMNIHLGQKPFACNKCDKKFKRKQYLIIHLRTHLAQKPFACERCDKQFYRKHHLVRHMITHI